MKNYLLSLLLLSTAFFVHGQSPGTAVYGSSSSEVRFSETSGIIRNDSVILSFNLSVKGAVVGSGEALHIIPVYRAGRNELSFPEILINGKKRAKYYRREQALLSHSDYWAQRPLAMLTLDGRQSRTLSYTIAKLLPADMRKGGSLDIEQFVEDCCDLRLVASLPVKPGQVSGPRPAEEPRPAPSPVATRPVYESSVTFIRPKKEIVKERAEHLTLRINYIVDRYDVSPHYGNNADELQKVDNILRPLSTQRTDYQIKSASIRGYASPEAPYEYNMTLSQRRADGFKQYLISRYGLYHLANFPATGLGEDWDGLRRTVEQSNMMYRREVLSIIDGVGIFNGREKMLMDLAGGDPYRYMMQNFYPALRRMEMEVAYTVRSFEAVEAEGIIDERPQDLSQEEIYEVAQRRNKEHPARNTTKDYGREYDVAAKYFPDDATANINAASAALVRADLDEAWRYLSKVQDLPEACNNLGVYYWMRGDAVRAAAYFRRALNVKDDEEKASRNLKMLEEWQRDKNDRKPARMTNPNSLP